MFPNDQIAGGAYYKKILAAQGMTYLASVHNGFRQITNDKHAVIKPEDVAGLKIRVPGGEVYFKFWKAFGADPVAMSWSEAFTAIQQGIIDGQENGFSVTNSAKINEIQQYMTVWNYTYENYLFVANTKIFESLEPKTQELIRVKAKEACEFFEEIGTGLDKVEKKYQAAQEDSMASQIKYWLHFNDEDIKAFNYVIAEPLKKFSAINLDAVTEIIPAHTNVRFIFDTGSVNVLKKILAETSIKN